MSRRDVKMGIPGRLLSFTAGEVRGSCRYGRPISAAIRATPATQVKNLAASRSPACFRNLRGDNSLRCVRKKIMDMTERQKSHWLSPLMLTLLAVNAVCFGGCIVLLAFGSSVVLLTIGTGLSLGAGLTGAVLATRQGSHSP